MIQSTEIRSVRINIKRSYDDGNMKAGTIGLIVGVVIAVILVVVAIALLVFAKSSGRWCFADDEEAYRNSAQVYRFILQDIYLCYKKSAQTHSLTHSPTHSLTNSPTHSQTLHGIAAKRIRSSNRHLLTFFTSNIDTY